MKQNFASVLALGGTSTLTHAGAQSPTAPPVRLSAPPACLWQMVVFLAPLHLMLLGGKNQTHKQLNFLFAVEETSKMIVAAAVCDFIQDYFTSLTAKVRGS